MECAGTRGARGMWTGGASRTGIKRFGGRVTRVTRLARPPAHDPPGPQVPHRHPACLSATPDPPAAPLAVVRCLLPSVSHGHISLPPPLPLPLPPPPLPPPPPHNPPRPAAAAPRLHHLVLPQAQRAGSRPRPPHVPGGRAGRDGAGRRRRDGGGGGSGCVCVWWGLAGWVGSG